MWHPAADHTDQKVGPIRVSYALKQMPAAHGKTAHSMAAAVALAHNHQLRRNESTVYNRHTPTHTAANQNAQ